MSFTFLGACLLGLLFAFAPRMPAADAPDGVLLVANQADADLGIVDPRIAKQVARVAEGGTGHEVAVSLDGKTAYVPIYGDSSVGEAGSDGRDMAVIDIASRKVVN